MAISDYNVDLLNKYFGGVPSKVQLGTLIREAEQGGLSAGSVGTTELAADAVTNAKIADTAVSVEHLDSGIAPSHVVKYAGTFTTVGGGATESATVAGVVGTDIVQVTIKVKGATPRTIVSAAANTDAIDFEFSGDPSNDHQIYYTVFRAAA